MRKESPILILLALMIFLIVYCFLVNNPFNFKSERVDGTSKNFIQKIQMAPANTMQSTLVGYWKFDEGSGVYAYDSSGYNGTIQYMGTPKWTTGISGTALQFDGTFDFIRVPERNATRNGAKTVVFWAKITDFLKKYSGFFSYAGPGCSDSYYALVTQSGAQGVYYENSSDAIIRSKYTAGPGTINLGEWAQYAIVYNGIDAAGGNVTIRLYKNGELQPLPATAPAVGMDGLSVDCTLRVIGSQEDYPNQAYIRTFPGFIDEFMIFNSTLNSSDIAELYNSSRIYSNDTIPPSVPVGISATAISSNKIILNWNASNDNVGVAGYIVYRDGSPLASVPTNSYTDTAHFPISTTYFFTVSPSTSYTYTVAAYDDAYKVSAQSAPVSVTTPAEIPSGPFNLTVRIFGTAPSPGIPGVTSNPSGIYCTSGNCSAAFTGGTSISILPYSYIRGWQNPNTFNGWSGSGCSGTSGCMIFMDSDKIVNAYFGSYFPPDSDTVPPSISFISPLNGSTLSEIVQINVTALDE